jgi:hypothetical protein
MEAFLLYKSVVKFENMNVPKIIFFHERQGKARQGKARQGKARQGKAMQGRKTGRWYQMLLSARGFIDGQRRSWLVTSTGYLMQQDGVVPFMLDYQNHQLWYVHVPCTGRQSPLHEEGLVSVSHMQDIIQFFLDILQVTDDDPKP